MSVRQALIILNVLAVVAIVVVLGLRVFSLRRNPEPQAPQNKTPFLADEDLEGRRIERGATLFANDQSPAYDPTVSLLCADCHGVDGSGGSTDFTLEPDDPSCEPDAEITEDTPEQCRPVQVTWQAPPLNVAGLRYDRAALTQIITFGRPGTPMPAWGVESGEGVLNTQSIDDLVNYIESIQITPEKAKQESTDYFENAVRDLDDETIPDAQEAVTAAQTAV